MKKSVKRILTATISITMAGIMALVPASAAFYTSNTFAYDNLGVPFGIPEAYRFYNVINRFDGGIGVFDSISDICFGSDGLLYAVDKGNNRILVMDDEGTVLKILGDTMPDGTVMVVADEEEEEYNPEDIDTEENPEEDSEEVDIVDDKNIYKDPILKEAKLERTDYRIEVGSLSELAFILQKSTIIKLLNGTADEKLNGKSVENLTIALTGDFNISSASDVAKFTVTKYRYYYGYKVDEREVKENLGLDVTYEIAAGSSVTVNTVFDFKDNNIINNGTLEIMPNAKIDITGCTLTNDNGKLIQHYMGAIENTPESIKEGTKATYVINDDYSVEFGYLYLNKPMGICTDTNNKIYICDTENRRLITMQNDFSDLYVYTETMIRESADILGATYNFTPAKIGISKTGMMYILNASNYKGFFTLNAEGKFCGFVGATKVTASVSEVLINIFGSASQKQAIANKTPAPATNLYVVDNMVYSVVKPSSTEADPKRIMKINVSGSDLFPDGQYTISDYDESTSERMITSYVDVCVDKYGIVTVLDDQLGYILQINQIGEIVAQFGGKSNRQGEFLLPTALDINPINDRIYVADSLKGSIQIFEPTKFINLVHSASQMYFEGLYSDAVSLWEEVAAIDETYDLAYAGIAESLYGDGYNFEAMKKFEYAWNFEGYNKAFSDFRLALFRYYFTPIAISILALIVLICFGLLSLKRKSDELYK